MAATTTAKTATAKAKTTKTEKATTDGVKKPIRATKKSKASNNMAKMQAYFKEHRHEFKSLAFGEQQKELGKKWKTAPENPKNQ
ncbi:hypothetical protein M011DRAFT_476704 [Sporormia fimetaria CBS 119925]|uniref:Uncharacterized protein n=1 Tax=Sporormia fimetaria CBS 119925 TaxID=1340428 RepID=A0A6A6VBZ3_9PLEO|nr:hypothetical protein M011DRAFT_476704 [Sporormia fimetaria CBS 119925]